MSNAFIQSSSRMKNNTHVDDTLHLADEEFDIILLHEDPHVPTTERVEQAPPDYAQRKKALQREKISVPPVKTARSGLPSLTTASDFDELGKIIQIRSCYVPSCYMDKLLLENTSDPLSVILEQKWWPYADKIGDNHFNNIGTVKKHIRFRQDRGWVYEITGVASDPVVRLIDYQKPPKKPLNPTK